MPYTCSGVRGENYSAAIGLTKLIIEDSRCHSRNITVKMPQNCVESLWIRLSRRTDGFVG